MVDRCLDRLQEAMEGLSHKTSIASVCPIVLFILVVPFVLLVSFVPFVPQTFVVSFLALVQLVGVVCRFDPLW